MDMDRYLWPWHLNRKENDISPVSLSVDNTFDPFTRELGIDLIATFGCDLLGDFRFNCYLVEDSIVSGQDNIFTIPDREPYCHDDNWVYNPPGTIENYRHMNVLRDVLGGAWGTPGSLPGYVVDGQSYEFQYNYSVPDSMDANNLRVIGMVQKFNPDSSKCEIYNAKDMYLNFALTCHEDENDNSIKIFPNPCTDYARIQLTAHWTQIASIDLYGIDGRLIYRIPKDEMHYGKNEIEIDIGDLPAGMYYFRIQAGEMMGQGKMVKMDL
jgi:hypothetical protein